MDDNDNQAISNTADGIVYTGPLEMDGKTYEATLYDSGVIILDDGTTIYAGMDIPLGVDDE